MARKRYTPRDVQIPLPATADGWADSIFLHRVYEGSDGTATTALYCELEKRGPLGLVGLNLFRAVKCSERAKVYRGGNGRESYRALAYQRKEYSIEQLDAVLVEHAAALGIAWGWAVDPAQEVHRHILYVETHKQQQVSFHTGIRGKGPAYERPWDGVRGVAPARTIRWVSEILKAQPMEETTCATK